MEMKHIASLLLLSVVSSAFARPSQLYSDGAWILEDLNKKDPNALCIASTTYDDNGTLYRLEFSRSKKLPGPMDVQIRVQARKQPATSYTLTLKDETVLSFANLGEVSKRQFVLWNIPQHTDRLMAQLEDRKNLRIKPADASRDQRVEFEADGFKRVKEKMQEKCFANQPIYDLAFEDAFILKLDPINPLGITVEQTKELRKTLNAGYAIHLGILGTKDELVKLQAKFQNLINEKESLHQRIAHLQNSEIPSIISSQQQNDALEANSRAQLQQVTVTIGQQQSALNGAQAQLNTARTVIAPYEAEHADRESRARSARGAVNAGAQRLSEIDTGIRNAEYRINQLSNEAGALQNQNVRLDQDLRYARQVRARAEMDARNYRPRFEIEERLRRDGAYQMSVRELQTVRNNLAVTENALNDAKGRLLARQTELRVCQNRTSLVEFKSVRIPAQEDPERPRGPRYNPDRPRRPDQPTTPTQPTEPSTPAPTQPTTPAPTTPTTPTTPAVDCTSEQNAVNQAQQVVSNLEAQQRDARARVVSVERTINQIENRVENEVQRINQDLNERAQAAMRQEQRLENELSINIRRVQQISAVEIPQQQNIINSLSAERPSVQARYDQDGPVAARLERELADFERRVGWDAKVQAVQNAEALVSQRSNDLNRSLSQKSALENQITRCGQERTRLANRLVDAQNRKLQAEQRLVAVIQGLVPYDQEKARLEQQESDLRNQLATTAQDFESKLP